MINDIITEIVNECIELDATFTYYDVLTEARERNCNVDASEVETIVHTHKYPQYYKQTEITKDDRSFTVVHPSDRYADTYDITDVDILDKAFTIGLNACVNTQKSALVRGVDNTICGGIDNPVIGRQIPFKATKRTPSEDYTSEAKFKTPDAFKQYALPLIPKRVQVKIENTLPAIGNKEEFQMIEDLLGLPPQTSTRPLFDKRDRYSVTVSDVKLADLNIGDVVYVIIGMGYVTLSTEKPPLSSMANFGQSNEIGVTGTLTVDRYYNLRVNKNVLLSAINTVPLEYGGKRTLVTEISSIKVQSIESANTINLYPQA